MTVPNALPAASASNGAPSAPFAALALRRRVAGWIGAALTLSSAATARQTSVTQSSPPPQSAPSTQQGAPVYEIPDVLITETEAESSFETTPLTNTAARDVLSPKELEEAGALTLQEVFRRSPSFHVSEETGSDSLPNIAVRGVTGNDGIFRSVNVAMFADGIPLSGGPYGAPGSSGFPLLRERVYAIDVQRGGGAVRYGPNNVSGIINFLTRPIPERTTLEQRFSYDSFDDASSYTALGGSYGAFGFLLESVYKEGDTYRDHGDYELQNYSLKTRYDLADNVRSLLQLEFYDDDSDLADGLSLEQYQQDPEQSSSPQNRFTANQKRINHKLEWFLSDDTRVDLISYYYETERTFWLGTPLFYGDNPTYIQATPRPMNTWALQPQVAHHYEIGDGEGELLAGFRYHHENLTRRVERLFPDGTETEISDDEFEYDATSAFVQNDFLFGAWKITPGVRFESVGIQAENDAGFGVERNFVELLPAISASYELAPQFAVYSNVQSSFQPPAANVIEISNDPQEIEAQFAWMYEVGARAQTEDGELAADLTVYQIDYSDRLEPDPDNFDVFLNSGRSRHRGVELALDSDLGAAGLEGVSLWSAIAYNESEYQNGDFEGNETPGSPRWLLSCGGRYEHVKSGWFASLDGFFVDESFSDRENTDDINAQGTRGIRPSTVVWNAHTGLRRDLSDSVRFYVQLDARNVFDKEYFDVRSGRGIYPAAPFGYGATIGLTFAF